MCWEVRTLVGEVRALSGAVPLQLDGVPASAQRLLLLRAGLRLHAARINGTRATLPCDVLAYGGRYTLRLDPPHQLPDRTLDVRWPRPSLSLRPAHILTFPSQPVLVVICEALLQDRTLDVRWPRPSLSLRPAHIQTFPSQPVSAELQFARTACTPAAGFDFPDLWLQLLFCGHSKQTCHVANVTRTQVLFRRQVRGYPERVRVALSCDLFGIAGHYALTLTEAAPSGLHVLVGDPAYLKAAWSDQFVFNVHARSVFPCEEGVSVLFEYPQCILASADRVRVFARLRADVASVAPPSTLVYAAEARVTRGQHALRFPCSVFSERYVEYCFVYVSQAVTGAVSDLRVDCVPTMPVAEGESGNWGSWSSWSACSASCAGSRNRYRLCDSPPPRYGAKFCQGRAYESEPCGAEDCLQSADAAAAGKGCGCGGCQLRLHRGQTARIAAASTSCPGRSLWLLQADEGCVVQVTVEQVWLPCGAHWLRLRDGDSLSAALVAQLSGRPHVPLSIVSGGPFLLVEFFSDVPLAVVGCSGSFVARASPLSGGNGTGAAVAAGSAAAVSVPQGSGGAAAAALAGRLGALAVLALLLAAGAALGAQYVLRYRQYRLASSKPPAHAASTCSLLTLLSDVASLRRSHRRLPDAEPDEEQTDNEYEVVEPLQPDVKDFKTASVKSCGSSEKAEKNSRSSAEVVAVKQISSRASAPPVSNAAAPSGLSSNNSDKLTSERRNERTRRDADAAAARSAPARMSAALAGKGQGALFHSQELVSSPKARKELTNRECQLAGSEFSLSGPDHDLELDYYDYNVTNAGAVPGSLLGMDPAYLLWIPPFAPGCWEEEGDNLLSYTNQSELQSQHELHVFPLKGEYYTQVPPSVCKDQQVKDEVTAFCSTDIDKIMDNKTESTGNINAKDKKTDTNNADNTIRLSDSMSKLIGPLHHQEYNNVGSVSHLMNVESKEDLMLKEFSKKPESPVKVHQVCSVDSKESAMKKLSSVHADILDNIQFADEDEEDEIKCKSLIV